MTFARYIQNYVPMYSILDDILYVTISSTEEWPFLLISTHDCGFLFLRVWPASDVKEVYPFRSE
jgi:hypothetical protein